MSTQNSGALRGESAETYLAVIARSEATKQSTLSFLLPHGLLRFARNDGSLQSTRCHAAQYRLTPTNASSYPF